MVAVEVVVASATVCFSRWASFLTSTAITSPVFAFYQQEQLVLALALISSVAAVIGDFVVAVAAEQLGLC